LGGLMTISTEALSVMFTDQCTQPDTN